MPPQSAINSPWYRLRGALPLGSFVDGAKLLGNLTFSKL
jgi:hypothetical protein